MTGLPEPYSKILPKKTDRWTDRQSRKKEKKKGEGERKKKKQGKEERKKNYVGSVDDLFRLLSPKYRYVDTEKMLIGSVDVNS